METPAPHSVSMQIPVAWGDMDALGHVNNTVFLRWFESARILWWERLDPEAGLYAQGIGPILARTAIDYRRPVKYPDTIEVRVTTLRVGGKSVTLSYRVSSAAQGGAVVAEGETVIVLFDYRRNEAIAIDPELRRRMSGGSPAAPAG
jgi:acyl-CoA thioester hydrolase